MRTILSPVKTRSGSEIFRRREPGSELGWGSFWGSGSAAARGRFFQYIVFKDLELGLADRSIWSVTSQKRRRPRELKAADAIDPNLSAFAARGGSCSCITAGAMRSSRPAQHQLLQPGPRGDGRSGQDVGVDSAVHAARHGTSPRRRRTKYLRCSRHAGRVARGGEGAGSDHRDASDRRRHPDRTRPLCPYPQLAVYSGSNSIDEAANFICKAR